MFDTRDLLGAMLGSGMGGRNPRMAGFGSRSGGMLGGGGLGGMLGGGGLGGGGLGGGMMGGGIRPGGGGGMSGMQGMLLGALGTFAVNALRQRMQQPAQAAPDPVRAPQPGPAMRPTSPMVADVTEAGSTLPEQAADIDEGRARLLVRVMVAAANADMRIDEQERARILGKIEESGANQAAREFVEPEMRQPMCTCQEFRVWAVG